MSITINNAGIRSAAFAAGLLLCLTPMAIKADETSVPATILNNTTLLIMSNEGENSGAVPTPFPVVTDHKAGLEFDLGGSDKRKLQLQLNQPLHLNIGARGKVLDHGGDILGLDATLNVPLSNHFGLTAGMDRQMGTSRFQSLGSIQCMNGTLRADSYTASGCRFVNEPIASSDQRRFTLGSEVNTGNMSASLSWFTQDSEFNRSGARNYGGFNSGPGGQAVMGNSLLSPNLANPFLTPGGNDPLQSLNSEASGVDLNFKVGIATDDQGDIRVGLAFSRILEANYQGLYSNAGDAMSWTLAEPFNTASMDLEWSRGSFSSGIQAFYREPVNFLNRDSVDALTTFDVHFTWRTPWNANLSVGASNVLNAGTNTPGTSKNESVDPFESIYGRIPYVRYKQDL